MRDLGPCGQEENVIDKTQPEAGFFESGVKEIHEQCWLKALYILSFHLVVSAPVMSTDVS